MSDRVRTTNAAESGEVALNVTRERRWLIATAVAVMVPLLGPMAALAQTSSQGRASERIEQRQAKAQQLQPPSKDKVEAGVGWLETSYALPKLARGFKGFHPVWGGFPSGAGQAIGVEFRAEGIGKKYVTRTTPNQFNLSVPLAVTFRRYVIVGLDTSVKRLFGTPFFVNAHGGYQRNPQDDFYGVGNDSLEENRTNYLYEVGRIGGVVGWNAPGWLSIGTGAAWLQPNVGPGTDDRFPSTDEVFDPHEVPGLDRQPNYFAYDTFVAVDYRNGGQPTSGGFYYGLYRDFIDQDFDAYSFRQLEVGAYQYLPFLKDERVIALRFRTTLSEADAGQEVPFYYMPVLGGFRELRGFDWARFRDRNAMLLGAEYRAQVHMMADVALWIDAGKVFADHEDFNFDDLRTTYGVGLRFKSQQATFLRLDFAFGDSGFAFVFALDDPFIRPSPVLRSAWGDPSGGQALLGRR